MPIQLSNISSIRAGTFKFTDLSGSEKPLPPVNSIININIIEKVKDGYKVLIDGSVFLSKLPIHANANENILARVINHFPFTLSLDNLISSKGIDESLSLLLSKLNIVSSEANEKILKLFLLCKKPIVKSKLEKLSELLESSFIELDEDQLTDVILFLESGDTNYQTVTPSLINLFKSKNSDLASSILNMLWELNKLLPSSEFIKQLNSLLVIEDYNTDTVDPLLIRDYAVKLDKVYEFIIKAQEIISDKKTISVLQRLTNTLLIYKIRQAFSLCRGNINFFLIVKTDDKLELLEFDVDLHKQDFSFNLSMNPENLGIINAGGVYTSNILSLDISSNNESCIFLENNKHELENKLENNVHCRHKITFNSSNNLLSAIPAKRGRVNVKL